MDTAQLKKLDENDPLRHCQSLFEKPAGIIYLDGNSLGMMPKAVTTKIEDVVEQQWGQDLITSWNKHSWIDLPVKVGELIAPIIGAEPNQVICCDSISVNLFKVLSAAILLRPNRHKIISTKDNFPTDLYMVQGLEKLLGKHRVKLHLVDEQQLQNAIDTDTIAVLVTDVNFRTGRKLDLKSLTEVAHKSGALIIADLAHSAGVLPIKLDRWQVDFAVGCTYKYLNGGPGAPAFIYAAKRHQGEMDQPLSGWMGHQNAFAFSAKYEKADAAKQLLVGTPAIISMSAAAAALKVYQNIDINDIRDKSKKLTALFLQLLTESKHGQLLRCISPLNADERGSQLSFEFEYAYQLCQALIKRGVFADFRAPNYIRFGFAPLYNSFQEVAEAIYIIQQILVSEEYLSAEYSARQAVT